MAYWLAKKAEIKIQGAEIRLKAWNNEMINGNVYFTIVKIHKSVLHKQIHFTTYYKLLKTSTLYYLL